MKYQVYLGIAFRIITLCVTGMLLSLTTPFLHGIFNDKLEKDDACFVDCNYTWSATHGWYFVMMVLLFSLSPINMIIGSYKLINKHYPEFE